MPRRSSQTNLGPAALLLSGLLAGASPAQADEKAAFQQILKDRAETIVTVKLLITIKGGPLGADGQRMEQEVNGVMIDPKGLVLASSAALGGIPPSLRRLMSMFGGEVSVTPSDIKVLVGEDAEDLEGELVARDSELDLAWVRIKNPGQQGYKAVDLTRSVKARLGQRLLAVTRMDKYFDRAPVVEELRVAGVTTKPRTLYVPGSGLEEQLCTPVYTTDGMLVGVSILQLPELNVSAGDPFSAASQFAELESTVSGFILPAEEVVKATLRAREAFQDPESAGDSDE